MMKLDSNSSLWPLAVLAALVIPSNVTGQKPDAIKRAGAVFEKRCANCHTIPDPAVATDRGWLQQVNRTS